MVSAVGLAPTNILIEGQVARLLSVYGHSILTPSERTEGFAPPPTVWSTIMLLITPRPRSPNLPVTYYLKQSNINYTIGQQKLSQNLV